MQIFFELFLKILPLYLIIYFGYIAGKKLEVKRESISPLLLYIIFPVVCFKGIITMKISLTTLSYPIYFFLVGTLMAGIFYFIGKFYYHDKETATLLSLASSSANVGYYGLPVALIILGDKVLGTVILLTIGLSFYESTIGFFIAARGKHTLQEALTKTFQLPTIYIAIISLLLNYLNQKFNFLAPNAENPIFTQLVFILVIAFSGIIDKVLGAYTFLGNLIVGLGFADSHRDKTDYSFTALTFIAQFIVYPGIALLFIYLDTNYFHFYDAVAHKVMLVMSLVPTGANTIVLATQMKLKIHTAAVTVLASTVFALFYIPLFINIFWSKIPF